MGSSRSDSLKLALLPPAEAERFFSKLHSGQILQGRILWKLPDKKYLIHLLGRNLIAHGPERFSEGDYVTLRVESLGPPIVMSLSQETPAAEESEVVARILRKLKLPDSKLWRSLVSRALKNKKPRFLHQINTVA
ncbi:MAG: hypothetical protein DRQ02_10770 [Candidatus Latescibacterota bacterium]|nr:MAG: hypothetical protein DRQ02_10770 [Candidatus Latescibacterota bacterium]RKY71703.1 MAG: hypothetical protein DRQ24_06810 [Candidatus Latescibacterota bacterium]